MQDVSWFLFSVFPRLCSIGFGIPDPSHFGPTDNLTDFPREVLQSCGIRQGWLCSQGLVDPSSMCVVRGIVGQPLDCHFSNTVYSTHTKEFYEISSEKLP